MTQMLPETAQEMARRLQMPWRPDLLTGKTPEAADYQLALGKAYFNEGLERTGNVRDALHYYHGGPNRKLWGSKTRAYADAVLSRVGGR
jgi:soluble lytic murein transglycosylase-like protein